MTKPPRQSRYHCSSSPPPYLDSVLKQVRKASASQGFVRSKSEIRALAAKANQDYGDRGKADDLVRFLLNVGILIELQGDKCVYVDSERAEYILDCCDSKKEPTVVQDPARRVLDILREADKRNQVPPASGPAVPSAKPAVQPQRPRIELTKVLYLTPCEEDVWNTLALMVEERPDGYYLTLPSADQDGLRAWVAQHLKCDEERFSDVLVRFAAAQVLMSAAGAPAGSNLWRFVRHPFAYHVVRIEQRTVRAVKRLDVEVAGALEREFVPPPDKPITVAFKAFIESRFPGANSGSCYTKMVSYKPAYHDKYWGILYRHPVADGVVTLVCVPGFESLTLSDVPVVTPAPDAVPQLSSPIEVQAVASAEVLPQAAATEPSPPPEVTVEVPPMPAPKPSVAGPVSVRQLSAEDEEKRRRLIESADDEHLAKIIQDSNVLIENVKKSLAEAEAEKRRREAARLDALRTRRAQLVEERAPLTSRLAEIDRELSDIEAQLSPA